MVLFAREEWSRDAGPTGFKGSHKSLSSRGVDEPLDPRVAERERLHLSLARTAQRLDELERRLKQTIGFKRTSIRNLMSAENRFADHVAKCFKKSRRS